MKPKNFPGRKKERQIMAQRQDKAKPITDEEAHDICDARNIRTKKNRASV